MNRLHRDVGGIRLDADPTNVLRGGCGLWYVDATKNPRAITCRRVGCRHSRRKTTPQRRNK